jgi:hypothetical protein
MLGRGDRPREGAVGAVTLGTFVCTLGALHAVETGAVSLPPSIYGTLLRAVPILLTATAMVRAFDGARFRSNWLLVAGPSVAYTLYTFGRALDPVTGVAAGVASGVLVAALVAGAGHATGRGYRELVSSAVAAEGD